MHNYSLSDSDSGRKPAPQPGSLADLVGLAQGQPIYCTPSLAVRRRHPVAWHAVVFLASYWLTRFVVEPFNPLSRFRYASLWPADFADIFQPVIGSLFCGVGD
jgi:hypothetical protein